MPLFSPARPMGGGRQVWRLSHRRSLSFLPWTSELSPKFATFSVSASLSADATCGQLPIAGAAGARVPHRCCES